MKRLISVIILNVLVALTTTVFASGSGTWTWCDIHLKINQQIPYGYASKKPAKTVHHGGRSDVPISRKGGCGLSLIKCIPI